MTTREKVLVFIAMLLLVTFGYVSVINYFNSEIEVAIMERDTLQATKDEMDLKLGMIDQLKDALETNTADLEKIKQSIQNYITDEETDTYFTDLATGNNLTIYALQISNEVTAFSESGIDLTNIKMKEVSLSLEGNVDDFIALVDDLNAREDILIANLSYDLGHKDDMTLEKDENEAEEVPDTFDIRCIMFMEVE